MSGALQLRFYDYEQVYAKKKSRRQIFPDEMEVTIPWDDFHELIRPVYHQLSSKGGRPSVQLEVMLRIHLLQQWFTLSDPLMEEMHTEVRETTGYSLCAAISEWIRPQTWSTR